MGDSVLTVLRALTAGGDEAAAFRADPDGFLAEHGLDGLDGHDVVDALSLGWSSLDPGIGQHLTPPGLVEAGSIAEAFGEVLPDPHDPLTAFDLSHDPGDIDFGRGALDHGAHDDIADDGSSDAGPALDLDLDHLEVDGGFAHGDIDEAGAAGPDHELSHDDHDLDGSDPDGDGVDDIDDDIDLDVDL